MPSAVLVAEPEPETREYLGRQLRDDGFDVLGAARRSEALELAESARPDLVLLAELELCLRLRRGEPGRSWDRNVPVIVLAPSSDPVERVRALDRGADDVIGRPFAYEELAAIKAIQGDSAAATSAYRKAYEAYEVDHWPLASCAGAFRSPRRSWKGTLATMPCTSAWIR